MKIQMGPKTLIRRPLVVFETSGETNLGGNNPPTNPPANPPVTPPGNQTGEKTFTQEEVNAIVASRARDLVKKETGVESLEDLKKRLTRTQELEDAQKTEHEKALDAAKKAGRKEAEEEAEQRIRDLEETANRRLIKADVISVATTLGFHDSEDAWLRVSEAITDARIKVDDKGNVVGTKAVLDKIAKDKPYLIKNSGGPGTPRFDNTTTPLNDIEAKKKAAEENARLAVFGGRRVY